METINVNRWNKFTKMTYIAMMLVSVLSIVNVVLNWSSSWVRSSYYYDWFWDYYYMTSTVTLIISYLGDTLWILGVVMLFCLAKQLEGTDRKKMSVFKIGVLVYVSLVWMMYLVRWTFGYSRDFIMVMMLLKMGCFVVMMIGAINLSKSKTFPNSKGMSMIMISTIFTLLSYVCYFIINTMAYNDLYYESNFTVLRYVSGVFSIVSDIFWLIGWVKLSKRIN